MRRMERTEIFFLKVIAGYRMRGSKRNEDIREGLRMIVQ
jgi:hypothetical protein